MQVIRGTVRSPQPVAVAESVLRVGETAHRRDHRAPFELTVAGRSVHVYPAPHRGAAWIVPSTSTRGPWRDLADTTAGRWHVGDAPHADVRVELRGAFVCHGDEVEVWGTPRAGHPGEAQGYRDGAVDAFDAVLVGVGAKGMALARALSGSGRPRGRALAAAFALTLALGAGAASARVGAFGLALPALSWLTLAGVLWAQATGVLRFAWPGGDDARLWLPFGALGAGASTLWLLAAPREGAPAAVALASWTLLATGAWRESSRDGRAESSLLAGEGVERGECAEDEVVMPLRGRVAVTRASGEPATLSLHEVVWATAAWTRHRDHRGGEGWYPAFAPGAAVLRGGLTGAEPWRPRVVLAGHGGAEPEAILARSVALRRRLRGGLAAGLAAAMVLAAGRWYEGTSRAPARDARAGTLRGP